MAVPSASTSVVARLRTCVLFAVLLSLGAVHAAGVVQSFVFEVPGETPRWVGWRADYDDRPLKWFPWVTRWEMLPDGGALDVPSLLPSGARGLVVLPTDEFFFDLSANQFEVRQYMEDTDGWIPLFGSPAQATRVWGSEGNEPQLRPTVYMTAKDGPFRLCHSGSSSMSPRMRWVLSGVTGWGWDGPDPETTLVVSVAASPARYAYLDQALQRIQFLSVDGLDGWTVRRILWTEGPVNDYVSYETLKEWEVKQVGYVGPLTKWLAPALDATIPPRAWIAALDEDVYYPAHTVAHAMAYARHWGRVAVSFSGWQDCSEAWTEALALGQAGPVSEAWAAVQVLATRAGVVFRKEWLGDDLVDWLVGAWPYRNAPEVLLSGRLATRGYARRIVRYLPEAAATPTRFGADMFKSYETGRTLLEESVSALQGGISVGVPGDWRAEVSLEGRRELVGATCTWFVEQQVA